MRKINALLLLLVLFSSCHFMGGRRVRGNGNLSSQTRSVGSFSGLRVPGGLDVVLTPGSNYEVKVEADENLLQYISTDRDGDVLVIKTHNGYNLQSRSGMKVYVAAPSLDAITVTGSGSVMSQARLAITRKMDIDVPGSGDVKLEVDAPQVNAEASGSGNIILSGVTRDFSGEINGSGDIKCFNLKSENTDVDISGSGNAEVFASKKLDIKISGSGDVAYKGTPVIHQRIAGSGDVRNVQ